MVHEVGIRERAAFTVVSEEDLPSAQVGGGGKSFLTASPSYKEALLGCLKSQAIKDKPSVCERAAFAKGNRLESLKRGRKCFRCFTSDHLAATCRDPARCLVCAKIGHRANLCPSLNSGAAPRVRDRLSSVSDMDRVLRRRGRLQSSKDYIPYTEELLRRTELKRNAMLVDIV